MDKKRLEKQIDFILEIDKEKRVFRQTHITGGNRTENDAEHAWHMAIAAYLLREYSNEDIDISKVMIMCLIHDIVEIDAGDTYAFDTEMLKTQSEREKKAAERIFSLLPEEQADEMKGIFEEFEEYKTAEAKFAHAIDNFQPLLLNNSNSGIDWIRHGATKSMVYGRQMKTALGSEELCEYTKSVLEKFVDSGVLKDEKTK